MRLVLDTNVIVSALLNKAGAPAAIWRHVLTTTPPNILLVSDAMLDEYTAVLLRPKFRFSADDVHRELSAVARFMTRAVPSRYQGAVLDEKDRSFIEAAIGGGADCLVTGNTKHFVGDFPFAVLTPREWVERHGHDLP